MSNTVLFVSDGRYINSSIKGGVQLCTHEYLQYIKLAGYEVREFPVSPSVTLLNSIKIKLGIEAYDLYNVKLYTDELVQVIISLNIKLVFLNQLNLSRWAAVLKKQLPANVKFIGLSHGNESADYLHEITRFRKARLLQTWKLGKLLVKEQQFFSRLLDGIIVLNAHEVAINQWIGAENVIYLPRILKPMFVHWQPAAGRAGFAGTLDHIPNLLGLKSLAEALQALNYTGKLRLVGGPPKTGKEFARQYNFIEYAGAISDEQLINEVSTWSVLLNPVFWYARGASTKLAQAINWGVPCLTTPAGRRGYELSDEKIVTTDNTPATFARMLVKIMATGQDLNTLKAASENNALNFNGAPHVEHLKAFIRLLTSLSS